MDTATKKIEFHDIGIIHIETAIDLYNQGNYMCAVTLAGAAEEFFGKLLSNNGSPTGETTKALDVIKGLHNVSNVSKNYDFNAIKNAFKHGKETICEEDIDIRSEAELLIFRAIFNFKNRTNEINSIMAGFLNRLDSFFNDGKAA